MYQLLPEKDEDFIIRNEKVNNMLIIITALYCEAKPFINQYQLKKSLTHTKFQVFENDATLLLITGPGSIAAASSVSYLFALRPPTSLDVLINIGICGAWVKDLQIGSVYLINKITEEATDRSFYPDIIFRHPFAESDLVTVNSIIRIDNMPSHKARDISGRGRLFDMEASAVYQAASYYIQPHQLCLIKLISDYGEQDRMVPDRVTHLLEQRMEVISVFLERLRPALTRKVPIFDEEEEKVIKELAVGMHCSVTMEYQLRQQLHYYKLIHGGICDLFKAICSEQVLPCKTKKEGMKYLEQLRKRII